MKCVICQQSGIKKSDLFLSAKGYVCKTCFQDKKIKPSVVHRSIRKLTMLDENGKHYTFETDYTNEQIYSLSSKEGHTIVEEKTFS